MLYYFWPHFINMCRKGKTSVLEGLGSSRGPGSRRCLETHHTPVSERLNTVYTVYGAWAAYVCITYNYIDS